MSLKVEEVAKIMQKSPQFVRIGLQKNIFPFGFAVKMSSKYTYHISKKKFYEYMEK